MVAQLVYARILFPCSKSKTVSTVFPRLYQGVSISEDQVYDGCAFIRESYKKYIELFNHCYEEHYKLDFSSVFFDCTNYYFEIDIPKEDKQKGASKENRHDSIIGQALLLDADLIHLAMQMYPRNESEKPYIRNIIQEMIERYNVTGKTVQVAGKGLNCTRNIYTAIMIVYNSLCKLKRGLEEVLLLISDELSGIADAVKRQFPLSDHQSCWVHLSRSVSHLTRERNRSEILEDLKVVYTSSDADIAQNELDAFLKKYVKIYPRLECVFERKDSLFSYYHYPQKIRASLYTSNLIENCNKGLKHKTKVKEQFPNED